MKIQIITTAPFPRGAVTTNRIYHLCKGLVENGADVEVYVSHPTETEDKKNNHDPEGIIDGIKFRYAGNIAFRRRNVFIRKAIDIYCHLLTIVQLFLNSSCFDRFIVIGPSFDFRLFLLIAAKIKGSKFLLEINEYPFVGSPESRVTSLKRKLLLLFFFPLYDGFIVISHKLDELITIHKSPNASSIIIPIIGDNVNTHKNSTSPLDVPYIIHAGSLNESKDGIYSLLNAFKIVLKLYNRPCKLVITGDGKNTKGYTTLVNYIERFGLTEHVVFTGVLNKEELDRYIMNSSLAVINKSNNLQNQFCFATKITDYLRCKVPMIITNVGEPLCYFFDQINAYLIDPDDLNQLVNKILYVLDHPTEAKCVANNASLLMENEFNYLFQGKRLYSYLENL